jgi:hypothetical protein
MQGSWTFLANLPLAGPNSLQVPPAKMPPYPRFGFSPKAQATLIVFVPIVFLPTLVVLPTLFLSWLLGRFLLKNSSRLSQIIRRDGGSLRSHQLLVG